MWQERGKKDGLRGQFYAKTTVRRSWKWYARAPVPCQNSVNIFSGQELFGLSSTALSYIAGVLTHGKSLMAFTNPTTNSYRRLTPGFEAPTTAVFGLGNRTAAVRIPAYVKILQR